MVDAAGEWLEVVGRYRFRRNPRGLGRAFVECFRCVQHNKHSTTNVLDFGDGSAVRGYSVVCYEA